MRIANPASRPSCSAAGFCEVCRSFFMNHAARPVLVFEQNGLTRTIHDPSWYQLLLRQAQA